MILGYINEISRKQVSRSSSWPERVVCLSTELRVTDLGEELRLTGSSRQLRKVHFRGELRDTVLGRGSGEGQGRQDQEKQQIHLNHVPGPKRTKLLEKAKLKCMA